MERARGPLRVLASNPAYFTVDGHEAIYLRGCHTWSNFQDYGAGERPFDFEAYLELLCDNHHNFIRLWAFQGYDSAPGFEPWPYVRSGPGEAADGRPRCDLTRLDPAYFQRLRARVDAAGERGLYVGVMLFQTYSSDTPADFAFHPYNPANNVNGVTGVAGSIQALGDSVITEHQERYMRAVVDALSECDNVLWEISNEVPVGDLEWETHFVDALRRVEAARPRQHLIGVNSPYGDGGATLEQLIGTGADYVALPWASDAYDPPAARTLPVLADTDHIGCVLSTRDPVVKADWAWKSFLRGLHPIDMEAIFQTLPPREPRPEEAWNDRANPAFPAARHALGQTAHYARRLRLAAHRPHDEMSSTHFCLASPAAGELLTYAPRGGRLIVALSEFPFPCDLEWLDVMSGKLEHALIDGGSDVVLQSPFGYTPTVAFIRRAGRTDATTDEP